MFVAAASTDVSEHNPSHGAAQAALAYLARRYQLRPEIGRVIVAATGLGGVAL